ncbi:MAG: hypothetical protein VYA30_16635 [Myxococcota bacterium]|nr:hypothetical protein [Myxococcota bacterium]
MHKLITVIMLLTIGCHQLPDTNQSNGHDLTDLKARGDNYVSTNAREYAITGRAHAQLPENFDDLVGEARGQALQKSVDRHLMTVSRSVRKHIDAVLSEFNNGVTGEKATYFTYFRRGESQSSQNLEIGSDGRIAYDFRLDFVGSVYLMSKLAPGRAQTRRFEVDIVDYNGRVSETIGVNVKGSEAKDAFPRYAELFEDGVLDIGIHFGGDYNEERFDLETAKWLVGVLVDGDWTHPTVKEFDDLKIDSGPFKRTLNIDGGQVIVELHISHSDMVEPADEALLSDAIKTSLATRDIVLYSGHAGENSGFIMDYQPRHEIRASEFASIPMANKYQIYLMDGCRTYRTYIRDIMANPTKTFENVDIVTTINTTPFSAGFQLIWEFIYWMTLTNDEGRHLPLSWKAILRGVNRPAFKSVHYGVHGIANNPQLNPNGSTDVACTPCTQDADCGAGGNLCLGYGGGGMCGVACTHDTACGNGYRCARLVDDPELFYIPKQCVRRDYACR